MYLLIFLSIATIIGVVIGLNLDWLSTCDTAVWISTFISGLLTIIMLVILAINHWTADSTIAQYEIIKDTIETARNEDLSELERATLTQKIIEVNQEIARYKYWNETSWDIFTPDRLTELEYLK